VRVIYNGIDLGVLETYEFNAEAVYDDSGVDYLYTRFTGTFRAIVNGQADVVLGVSPNGPVLSYQFGSPTREVSSGRFLDRGKPLNPVVGDRAGYMPVSGVDLAPRSRLRAVIRQPNAPPLTHQVVRHRLMTPRAQLWVFAGPGAEEGNAVNGDELPSQRAVAVLGSPNVVVNNESERLSCDCRNGPRPKLLGCSVTMGDANTMMVDWSFETFVIESELNSVSATGLLLSNRFAQTQLVASDGYTTVVTAGTAIFRTDLVYKTLQSPDSNRPVLFMPIPQGFARENVQVTGLPDVTGVEYSYRDRQVPVNFVAGPYVKAASISAVHRQAILSNSDMLDGALRAYERVLGMAANLNIARADADRILRGEGNAKAIPVSPPKPNAKAYPASWHVRGVGKTPPIRQKLPTLPPGSVKMLPGGRG
jgi:hypothetical protein